VTQTELSTVQLVEHMPNASHWVAVNKVGEHVRYTDVQNSLLFSYDTYLKDAS
jgi:hypothetical protein